MTRRWGVKRNRIGKLLLEPRREKSLDEFEAVPEVSEKDSGDDDKSNLPIPLILINPSGSQKQQD